MIRSILIVMILSFSMSGCSHKTSESASCDSQRTLTIMCGAGIQPAMETLKSAFEIAHACKVRVIYAGSGTLMGQIQVGVDADLYLPGDKWWVDKAMENGHIDTQRVVAWFAPVIVVQKGNPKHIQSVRDLMRKDVEVGIGKPEACAIGNVTCEVLETAGITVDQIHLRFEALTVNNLANQVKLKALDAAVVWSAVAKQYPDDLDMVAIADPLFHAVPLSIGLLKNSKCKDLAQRFMDFALKEAGAESFRDYGCLVPGTQIRIGCGSSMYPPVDELAKRFESLTGCKVLCDYGGSGTVLLQLEESKEGDIYICHDPYAYLCEDKNMSERWHTIARLEPVMAVQKGNPKQIRGLKDLLREDINIGLSHRKYSTRGKMLWTMFRKHGIAEILAKRKFFEERTHTLVNQLKLGAIDVATLWDAPAKAMEEIDVIPFEEEYMIDAVTSATTGKTYSMRFVKVTVVRLNFSREPLLAAQFAKMCLSDEGRKILAGHHYQLPDRTEANEE